jgi:metal-sulfur cluster biosynthetic enzyme
MTASSLEATVLKVLDEIVDPCSAVAGAPIGIVSMGLVRRLSVEPGSGGAAVRVRIGVTEPGCLMAAPFIVEARERLENLEGVSLVDVRVDTEDDWSPSDMSEEARARLEAVRSSQRQSSRPSVPIVRLGYKPQREDGG